MIANPTRLQSGRTDHVRGSSVAGVHSLFRDTSNAPPLPNTRSGGRPAKSWVVLEVAGGSRCHGVLPFAMRGLLIWYADIAGWVADGCVVGEGKAVGTGGVFRSPRIISVGE